MIGNSGSNIEKKEICTEQLCLTTMLKYIKIKTILKFCSFSHLCIYESIYAQL